MLTAWDRGLARRAAALAGLTGLVTLVVIAATDEGAPWARRAGMAAALLPIAGALGALGAIRAAAARGELRALAALGVDPARSALGAVLGGALLAAIGPLLAATGLVDLGGLFPRPAAARAWIVDGAAMVETTRGLRVAPGGALARIASTAGAGPALEVPRGAALAVVVALALAALGGPLWTAAAVGWGQGALGKPARLAGGIGALVLGIAAFQAVAAGRLPPAALGVAPLALLIDGLYARRAARRGA